MSLVRVLSFYARTGVVGRAMLRYQRLRDENKLRRSKAHPHLAPPLRSVPELKELISTHYLHARYAEGHKKVAWVTSGAPVEVLKALGFFTLYPENHAAMCGARRQAEELCRKAEKEGYSADLCSYARTDIGSVLSGMTPVGRLSKPDLLVCCTNICQTVLYWYQVLADHFKAPLVVVDAPFVFDTVTEHAEDYVTKQMEHLIETAERIAGRTLTDRAAKEAGRAGKEAALLWNEILSCCKHHPSPISAFDQFFFMAPIVDMRGEQATVDFYRRVLAEVRGRIADGVGAVINERKRLLWDNLPIWFQVRNLSNLLAAEGCCIVTSTYTNAWGELAHRFDADDLIRSAARVYLQVILNQSAKHKLDTMNRMVDEYSIDGVILHNNRSCKPYSIGQIDQRRHLAQGKEIPALLLEADHNDPRSFSEQELKSQFNTFLEMLR